MQRIRGITFAVALLCSAAAFADPVRVVSINLCTDQLAMLLARPGQLVSVSRLSQDPANSPMHQQARGLHGNSARAEEVYLLEPDLVLAGTFTDPTTLHMLEGLGIPVVQFEPALSLEDIPVRIAMMGDALGRQTQAQHVITAFQSELAALSDTPTYRPRAALTYVNSYSAGNHTLAGGILLAAGFANVAHEIGLDSVGRIGLEDLVLLAPDVIIQGSAYRGATRASNNLRHPALRALGGATVVTEIVNQDWVCGTPHVLDAIRSLRDVRLKLERAE